MTGPVRVGLAGCGRLAEAAYVPALAAAGGVTLVAVADPDPRRRARLARVAFDHGMAVRAHPDAAALLRRSAIDALVVATPVDHHLADATLAATAGIPVLVEKPPAPDLAGATQLAALGPAVHIGFNRRFDAGARRARDAVPATGPLEIDLELTYRRASWGSVTVRDEVLVDLVPHLVDWARWLSGATVTHVAAAELSHDRARLALDLGPDRGRARVRARADGLHRERIEVRDRSGSTVARHAVGGPAGAVLGRFRRGTHPLVDSLAAQLGSFARTLRGATEEPLATAADGVAAMAVVDAARHSAAADGRPTPIPHAPIPHRTEPIPC